MLIEQSGHQYKVFDLNGEGTQTLKFRNTEVDPPIEGTSTQEVLCVLIDRSKHVENQLSHPNNARILYHLRMALVLHESRALERKVEKGKLAPEYQRIGHDGHFILF